MNTTSLLRATRTSSVDRSRHATAEERRRERRHRRGLGVTAALIAGCVATGYADVWDRQTLDDNTPASAHELIHGSNELHDLAALKRNGVRVADEDWFRFGQRSYSSYEVVIDSSSGDVCPASLTRVAADGDTVLQSGTAAGTGCSRSLRWMNNGLGVSDELVRIASGQCTTTCGTDDVYRLRSYETTYAIPRFNNTATQVSVLLVQNTSDMHVAGTIHFWHANGALIGTHDFVLNSRGSLVLNTSQVVPAATGSITITNDGRYGDLTGKVVALEPATGFSFDTVMTPRPL